MAQLQNIFEVRKSRKLWSSAVHTENKLQVITSQRSSRFTATESEVIGHTVLKIDLCSALLMCLNMKLKMKLTDKFRKIHFGGKK